MLSVSACKLASMMFPLTPNRAPFAFAISGFVSSARVCAAVPIIAESKIRTL